MRKIKGLYKRGNVYWMCFKVDGKLYRESTGVTTQKEAEHKLTCRRKEIEDDKFSIIKRPNCKFAELAKDYLKWSKHQKAYLDKARRVNHLVIEFGNEFLKDFTTIRIDNYKSKRLEHNMPATVNRMLTILKHMFQMATDWEMVGDSVLRRIRKVKQIPEYNTRLRFLTIEECRMLIDCCIDHLKPIVTVALNTGMRKSEILGLKWDQVDLTHGFILLDITKNGERREIPINTTLEYLFKELPHNIEKSIYVFSDPKTGKPYKEVKHSFNTALKKAGIYDFKFHDLRHTFASHLVMSGIDISSVKELLGHKSLTVTLRYAHLAPGHKRKAVNMLDKVLTNDQNEKLSSQFGSHPDPKNIYQIS